MPGLGSRTLQKSYGPTVGSNIYHKVGRLLNIEMKVGHNHVQIETESPGQSKRASYKRQHLY